MKRVILAVVILLGVAVGVAYAFRSKGSQTELSRPSIVSAPTNAVSQPVASSPIQQKDTPGVYADYSTTNLEQGKGTILLFFHAPWCPQCRNIEKDIKQMGVPSNVTILKVDYDSNNALRKQYGVTLQTTFVKVDTKGTQLKKFVAYQEPTLDNVIKNAL